MSILCILINLFSNLDTVVFKPAVLVLIWILELEEDINVVYVINETQFVCVKTQAQREESFVHAHINKKRKCNFVSFYF